MSGDLIDPRQTSVDALRELEASARQALEALSFFPAAAGEPHSADELRARLAYNRLETALNLRTAPGSDEAGLRPLAEDQGEASGKGRLEPPRRDAAKPDEYIEYLERRVETADSYIEHLREGDNRHGECRIKTGPGSYECGEMLAYNAAREA